MTPIKLLKIYFFSCIYKNGPRKYYDKSYTITDLYLNHNISFGYEDSYNYYDIDADKILLFVKSDNEYIIRYNDVNKKNIVSLQLKINNFYLGELHMLPNDITKILIYRDKYKNDLVFVLDFVFNDYFQASLVQYRY